MRLLLCSIALVLGILTVPGTMVGQDKTKDKDKVVKQDPTPQDYAVLAQMKDITGKIAAVDAKLGTMTLTIETSHQEPKDPQALANLTASAQTQQQQLAQDYQNYLRAKTASAKQQALARYQAKLLQLQNSGAKMDGMFKTVKNSKDYELDVMDSLKVARKQIADKYDDMGEIIKYSPEELDKLKSKDLPEGYTASPDDLQVGQIVKLYLSPPKKIAKTTDSSSSSSTTTSSTTDSRTTTKTEPQAHSRVRMTLIIEDAPPPPEEKTKKKKKNE